MEAFDIIIIGGGPAGYTAALYGARAGRSVLLLEKLAPGGQMGTTDLIDNYPGFPQGVKGFQLAMDMKAGAERFGAQTKLEAVTALELAGDVKTVHTKKDGYEARAVILATGAQPRELGLPQERALRGRGVSYCATCDGAFFRDLEVFVAGGGDSAVEEAIFLTRFARHVTIVHRRDRLRASRGLQERAFANEKISFLWDSVVAKAEGDGALQAVTVRHVKTGEETVFRASPADGLMGLFGFTGHLPSTGLFTESLPLENGYIPTGEDMSTAVPGVFAAGDIRVKAVRQVVTAAADGAIAAISAERFLAEEQV